MQACRSPEGRASVPRSLPLPRSLPCLTHCPHSQMPKVPPNQWVEMREPWEGEFSVVEASLLAAQELPSTQRGEAQEPRASLLGPKPLDRFLQADIWAHPGERHSVHHAAGEIMGVNSLLSLGLKWPRIRTQAAEQALSASRHHRGRSIASNDEHHGRCRAWVPSALKGQCFEMSFSIPGALSHFRSRQMLPAPNSKPRRALALCLVMWPEVRGSLDYLWPECTAWL